MGGDVRAVYDATADAYAGTIGTGVNPDFEGPVDRAVLAAFAELTTGSRRPVGDLGCGPGRVAAFLADRHVPVIGLDLSTGMLRVAGDAHADIAFAAGDLLRLPLAAGALGGAVCWYSIIHTPPERLPSLFREVCRTLAGAAPLLVAFQTADDLRLHREDAHGSGRPLTSYRHHVGTVTAALSAEGADVIATTVREPMSAIEPTAQAFLLARRR